MLEKMNISSADLRPKIILAFVVVALLVGVTGAVGYYSVGTVDDQAHHIADDGYKMDATSEMIFAVETQQEAILHAQLGHTQMAERTFTQGDDHFEEKGVGAFESYETSAAESQQLSSISELHDEYDAIATEFFEAQAAGNTDLAAQKVTEAEEISAELETTARELKTEERNDLAQQITSADETTRMAQIEMIGLTLGAFIAAIAIGLFVAKRLTDPMIQLSEAARAASEGDLTVGIDDHVEATLSGGWSMRSPKCRRNYVASSPNSRGSVEDLQRVTLSGISTRTTPVRTANS